MRKLSLAQIGAICIGGAIFTSSILGVRHAGQTTFTTGDKAEMIGQAVVIVVAWLVGLGLLITHFVRMLRRRPTSKAVISGFPAPKPAPTFDFLNESAVSGTGSDDEGTS
jgi:hypothetical protein